MPSHIDNPSLFDNIDTPRHVTLLELTNALAVTINTSPRLQNVWVIAELSDVQRRNHCYMELIQKDDTGATVAKIRATVWASRFLHIDSKFVAATGARIASGMKVLLCGSVQSHPLYGLSFNVSDIDPSYTLGDMERLRREILMRLHKEGVIEMNRDTVLPPAPQRIAVISAPTAAGYGDFMEHLRKSARGFVFYTQIFPATVQGEQTSPSIRQALERIEMSIDLWDCVVIIRGGGATTDLNGFDDYELARAVATFPIPVIVGIGHERDRTVLDEIAHTRCKTPTDVAAFLVDAVQDTANTIATLVQHVTNLATERLNGDKRQLAMMETLIPEFATARISAARMRTNAITQTIPALASRHIAAAKRRPDLLTERLRGIVAMRMQSELQRLRRFDDMVSVLSPANTLKRGYSVTRIAGHAVKDIDSIPVGTIVETETAHGKFASTFVKGENNTDKQ